MTHFSKILFSLWAFLPAEILYAQSGIPDPSFGTDGTYKFVSSQGFLQPVQIVCQSTGGIVMANSGGTDEKTRVRRLTDEGVPDPTFSNGGVANVYQFFSGLDLLHATKPLEGDKTLLVIKTSYSYPSQPVNATLFARLNADGTPDASFGQGGKVVHDFYAGTFKEHFQDALVLDGGKILVSGVVYTNSFWDGLAAITRLNSNGSRDSTFENDGLLLLSPGGSNHTLYTMVKLADGKILATGVWVAYPGALPITYLVRLNADGTVDDSFGQDGFVDPIQSDNWYSIYDMALSSDGNRVYAAGQHYDPVTNKSSAFIACFGPDGKLDATFQQGGLFEYTSNNLSVSGRQVEVYPDGRILFGGEGFSSPGHFVLRLDALGNLDPSFGNQGVFNAATFGNSSLDGMVLQDNGLILLSGSDGNDMYVTRLLCDGCTVGAVVLPAWMEDVLISPNPTTDVVNLRLNVREPLTFSIQLMNAEGKFCATLQPETTSATGENQIALILPPGLPAGQYQLVLTSDLGMKAFPLVIK